jgi:Glycosyl transferase family 11
MIAVRIEGRLGNQLFQYAFILTTAKTLNTNYYIDQYIQPSVIEKYFYNVNSKPKQVVNWLFGIKGCKNIFSFYLRRLYYKYVAQLFKLSVLQYPFTALKGEIKIQNNTIYQGYFQSEFFFKPIEETIRNKFALKPNLVDQFNVKYGSIYRSNKIVTVHIRRTDYQNLPHLDLGSADLTLPISYYQKALSNYIGQNVYFIFISDDIAFVEDNFKHIKNKTISADSEIMDFQHLLNADVCIISNSTFSWWGAWLNSKKSKAVYCPQYYMGYHLKKEVPDNIYPDDWIQIEF